LTQLERKLGKIVSVLFLLLIALFAVPGLPTVTAAGSLYVSPAVITPQAVNTTFSIQVKVAGFDQFNAWEIQVVSDPAVINATSISTARNIFLANTTGGIPFEIRNCVNGAGKGCCLTSCAPLDGAGIADSAYGDTKSASGSGLLFNVTFKVVSNKLYSPILLQTDQVSGGGPGGLVIHTTASGSYGTAPDFSLKPDPASLVLAPGSSKNSTITVVSLNHFSGLVNLTATSSGKGVSAILIPNQTTLSDGGTGVSILAIRAQANASATSYTITLSANSSSLPPHSLPHTKLVNVALRANPDFTLTPTTSVLLTHQASSNSTIITVGSLNNFTGTVILTVVGPTPATLDKTSLTIPNGGTATTTLTINTQSSPIPFEDDFFIIATNGSLTHTTEVIAQPPPGDFSIATNPATATVQAGSSEVVSIAVASQDYFIGTVYVLGASKSGLGLSFDPGSIFLNFSQTVFFNLKVTTDTLTTPGNHTIDLTVYGQQIGKAGQGLPSRQHTTTLAFIVTGTPQTVASTPTFLGLQEPVFYVIIGALALGLAVLGIFEIRRSNRPKNRLS
jgi:hypothetical protein